MPGRGRGATRANLDSVTLLGAAPTSPSSTAATSEAPSREEQFRVAKAAQARAAAAAADASSKASSSASASSSKRGRRGRTGKWWHSLEDDDPISLEPLADLLYAPFAVEEGGGEEAGGKEFLFDGKILALYIMSTGVFENPLSRAPIERSDCQRLDQYLREHGLGAGKVLEAFDLQRMVKVKGLKGSGGGGGGAGGGGGGEEDAGAAAQAREARVIQREATTILTSLFEFQRYEPGMGGGGGGGGGGTGRNRMAYVKEGAPATLDSPKRDRTDHLAYKYKAKTVHKEGGLAVYVDERWGDTRERYERDDGRDEKDERDERDDERR